MSQLSPEETMAHPFAPKIIKKLPESTVSQDKQMVKFEVKVVGHPKPEIKWLKHGEEIIPSEEFQIENLSDGTSILIINDVYPDDTGEIKVVAYNSVGVAETMTQFFVEGKRHLIGIVSTSFYIFSLIYFNVLKDFFTGSNIDLQQNILSLPSKYILV